MKTVVVTGGTGYIAGFVIQEFLEAGFAVRASVRSVAKGETLVENFNKLLGVKKAKNLTTFVADLSSKEGWDIGMKGADGVIHVASPLGGHEEDAAQLINIAVNGTLNVFQAANEQGIKRIVMTSSEAAATALQSTSGTLSETFWTDESNPELDAYRLSKLKAEQAAWEFAQTHHLALTTLLPGMVLGNILEAKNLSTNTILLNLLTGKLPFTVNAAFDITNVSDLATLQRLAFENDKAIGQRYFAASQILMMPEIAALLRTHFPEKPITKVVLEDDQVRAIPELADFLPMLDRNYCYSTQKAKSELGWLETPARTTLLEAAKALQDKKLI